MNTEVAVLGLKVAEVFTGAAFNFVKETVPEDLKPREPVKRVKNPETLLSDVVELKAIRSELKKMMQDPENSGSKIENVNLPSREDVGFF